MEVVEAMLARKVILKSQGWKYGGTIQAAARNGSVELVRRLLNLGANANIKAGEFGTALREIWLCVSSSEEGKGEGGDKSRDHPYTEAVGC